MPFPPMVAMMSYEPARTALNTNDPSAPLATDAPAVDPVYRVSVTPLRPTVPVIVPVVRRDAGAVVVVARLAAVVVVAAGAAVLVDVVDGAPPVTTVSPVGDAVP